MKYKTFRNEEDHDYEEDKDFNTDRITLLDIGRDNFHDLFKDFDEAMEQGENKPLFHLVHNRELA